MQQGFDLTGIADAPAPRPRPPRAPRKPSGGFDLSGIADAPEPRPPKLSRPPKPYGADDSLLEGVGELPPDFGPSLGSWFEQTYKRPLPVTARGQSKTHDARDLDHRHAMDVGLHPQSEEGRALINYLRERGVQYLAYNTATPGAATGPHIHIGRPSRRRGAAGGAGGGFDLTGIADAFDLEGIAGPPEGEEVVRTEARPEVERPRRTTTDPYTVEGRANRDARRAALSDPKALFRIPLRAPEAGTHTREDVVKQASERLAAEYDLPETFVRGWLEQNRAGLYDPATGASESGVVPHVSMQGSHLGRMLSDYQASLNLPTRAAVRLGQLGDYSPGEHLVEGAAAVAEGVADNPVARGVGRGAEVVYNAVGEPILRSASAADTYIWAKAAGLPDLTAQMLADMTQRGVNIPLSNPVGEAAARLPLVRENPRAQAIARAAGGLVQPTNAIPLPPLAALGRSRAARAAGEVMERAAPMRGVVNPRPLGLSDEVVPLARPAAAPPPPRRFVVDTGTGDVFDPATGDVLFEPPPHHSARQPRTPEGKFDGPPAAPSTLGQRAARVAGSVIDLVQLPKALRASGDLSATLQQGGFQLFAHPRQLRRVLRRQVGALVSEREFTDFARSIVDHPDYKVMREAGLYLASPQELAGRVPRELREEAFASGLARRTPGVRQSNRAYAAALDTLRLRAWDEYTRRIKADPKATRDTYRAAAEFINITTGRGVVPVLDRSELGRKIVSFLNLPLFSPRRFASRLNLLSPARLVGNALDPSLRPVAKIQAKEAARFLGTMGMTYALLEMVPGVEVGWNPFEAGFGKVRVGSRTVYDLSGGEAYAVQTAAQIADSLRRISKGERVPARRAPWALAQDYARRQLSPSGKVAADWVTGETQDGEPFSASGAARDLAVPMVVEGVYEGWVEGGGSSLWDVDRVLSTRVGDDDGLLGRRDFGRLSTGFVGAASALPGVLGAGVRYYDNPEGPEPPARSVSEFLTPLVGSEVARLRIDLRDVDEGKGKRSAEARPGWAVKGFDGEDIKPLSAVSMVTAGVTQEEAARRVAEEVNAAASELIASPDWRAFHSDSERRAFMVDLIMNARARALNPLATEGRFDQQDEYRRLEGEGRRIEEKTKGRPTLLTRPRRVN